MAAFEKENCVCNDFYFEHNRRENPDNLCVYWEFGNIIITCLRKKMIFQNLFCLLQELNVENKLSEEGWELP